jgi:hypothetical protein
MPRKGPLTPEQIDARRAASLRWYHKNKASFSEEKRALLREHSRKAAAKYRDVHRKELNAKAREDARKYRAENLEKARASSRQSWLDHREERLAKAKAKREEIAFRNADNARRRENARANPERERLSGRVNYELGKERQPWSALLKSARERAKTKGLPFSLTDGWARSRWTGRCEITDIPFSLIFGDRPGPRFFSASIDQIVPKAGYTPENCRFVLWAVNALKHDGTDEDMIMVARAIIGNFSEKSDT